MAKVHKNHTFLALLGIAVGIIGVGVSLIQLVGKERIFPRPPVVRPQEQETSDLDKWEKACQLYREGKTDEATFILENLYKKNNESEGIIHFLIVCYTKKADILIDRGKTKESITILRQLFFRFPDRTIDILIKRLHKTIQTYEEKLEYENAIEFAKELYSYTKTEEDRKEIVRLLCIWGQRYASVNNPYSALDKFEEAYNIDPRNESAKDNLLNTYLWIGDIYSKSESFYKKDLAIEKYLKALTINPEDSIRLKISQLNLVKYEIFMKLKKYSEAEKCLKEIIFYCADVLPIEDEVRKYMEQTDSCLSKNFYKEAAGFFTKALTINPLAPYIYYKETSNKFINYNKLKDSGPFSHDILENFAKVKKFAESKVNINESDLVELREKLDISFSKAIEIVEKRPYNHVNELLSRNIFERNEFDQKRNKIIVQ